MKFIRMLSPKGVNLYFNNGEYIVVRNMTQEKLQQILLFYDTNYFKRKPGLEMINEKNAITHEEYLYGELLITSSYKTSSKVASHINLLSQKNIGNMHMKNYITEHFNKKIQSILLTHYQTIIIEELFQEFVSLCNNITIDTHWIHGDLKGDNIIMNNGEPYFIDWEWCKVGHFLEDIQKFIETILQYKQKDTDHFINEFYKHQSIDWKIFIFLESFHFFLNQILQLSKSRETLDGFHKNISSKINAMINSKIYTIDVHGKTVTIGTQSPMSDIFLSQTEETKNANPEHVILSGNMNNQEQRLEINRLLMLKYKDFLVIHGVCVKLVTGEVVIIAGPSGSGKTYVYQEMKDNGLIESLYDEDLVCIDSNGTIYSLTNKNFKGLVDGNYIYEDDLAILGKVDIVLFLDNKRIGVNKTTFNNKNILKYMLHEKYQGQIEVTDHYKGFSIVQDITSYVIGNNKIDTDFNGLIELLGKKSS